LATSAEKLNFIVLILYLNYLIKNIKFAMKIYYLKIYFFNQKLFIL